MATPDKKEKNIRNAIIFCGNGGVGKSYMGNRIFGLHNSHHVFKSAPTVRTVTQSLQQGTIFRKGKEYTIIDTPGFFDNKDPNLSSEKVDGKNMCLLVDALERCREIYAIVYMFTDRFSEPQKQWYDRLKLILTPAKASQIILLHNKVDTTDLESLAENKIQIKALLGGDSSVQYFWFGHHGEADHLDKFLTHLTQLVPFQLDGLIVPEICYEREEISPEFKKVVPGSEVEEDIGGVVTLTASDFKIVETKHYGKQSGQVNLGFVQFGFGPQEKTITQKLEPVTTKKDEHVKKIVIHRKVGVYTKVYRIRFDGTRDFIEDREVDVSRREDETFGDN